MWICRLAFLADHYPLSSGTSAEHAIESESYAAYQTDRLAWKHLIVKDYLEMQWDTHAIVRC